MGILEELGITEDVLDQPVQWIQLHSGQVSDLNFLIESYRLNARSANSWVATDPGQFGQQYRRTQLALAQRIYALVKYGKVLQAEVAPFGGPAAAAQLELNQEQNEEVLGEERGDGGAAAAGAGMGLVVLGLLGVAGLGIAALVRRRR